MRLIQAEYIFPIASPPLKNGIIRLDDHGKILELIDIENTAVLPDSGSIEKFKGFLCPGFINSHCHLELSHLRGKIKEKSGMSGFIKNLLSVRNNIPEGEVIELIQEGENEMISEGIVAVGDISNSKISFHQKSLNRLMYHTFIEVFDLGSANANYVFKNGLLLLNELKSKMPEGHSCSLAPHAPYTVSGELFSLLNTCAFENNSLMTMHNQESQAENDLFINKSGPLFDFFKLSGIDLTYITPAGLSSLTANLSNIAKYNKTLLVHNTYTTDDDINKAIKYSSKIYWCLCVNANLFIENRIPDITLFQKNHFRVMLGTDSLASNHRLSILDEMKTLMRLYPALKLEELLPWATLNSATFFDFDNTLGSFEVGKVPGVNLIENLDTFNNRLTEKSTVRRLH